jgi:hypothetical protein
VHELPAASDCHLQGLLRDIDAKPSQLRIRGELKNIYQGATWTAVYVYLSHICTLALGLTLKKNSATFLLLMETID